MPAERPDAEEARRSLARRFGRTRLRFWIGAYVFPEDFIDKIVDGLCKAGLPDRGAKV
jgi:hypothetical protein